MTPLKTRNIIPFILIAAIAVIAGCSTQKNTSKSRWWHSFNAKYNTYYNGAQAYIDGSLEKENGNKDNFTEIIPLYTVGNKKSIELGKSNFERAIEKAQKAIHRHSIKIRPEWNKSRKKTEKDIEWLSRKEYNPFLWKAWMLMGRSQFHKGAFDEAAATFSYMSRLYQTQPAIYGKARAWLAKCYIEQEWLYDAEDVIRNMRRDSIDWRAVKEWDYTFADYYIHTGEFDKAIPYLRKVIKHEMRRKQKAREWYLMGQLQAALGHKQEAYQAFKKVIHQNPSYELEFNARIAMTEVMAGGHAKQMIGKLKRMAASDNNKDYLDQVYYAMGNIYLAERDTMKAISAYEMGNEKATRNGIEKGVLLLHLGDLYWKMERFGDARRCYGEAIGLLDKDRKDYQQLSDRSKILDELVPFTDAIHLQDSLQLLAKMPEEERNAAIDRVIEALKKKEKEERKKQAEAEAAKQQGNNGLDMNISGKSEQSNTASAQTGGQQSSIWYFYNQMAVNQGKATFQKQWGQRENADNWQRANKTVVGNIGSDAGEELTEEQRDSIMREELKRDSLEQIADSAQNDPHKREYYLAQIPFTEEQLAASNLILTDGLHHAGVIFKDQLDNIPLSEKHLRRLTDNYPDYEKMDDVYYHLFLLYSRKNEPNIADSYIDKLKEKFPESQWTTLLTDPYFKENSKFGIQIEDSLYAATYEAFKKNRYNEVAGNVHISDTRFQLGANRDKFLFIGGLSKLNDGDVESCVKAMKEVVEKYPQSRISEMAGMIVNGVNAGKRLHGGKFDLDDVWSRRSAVLNDSDSIKTQVFSAERLGDYKFILVYHPDSISENKLLFEMAKFNFTNFVVRNFEINIEEVGDLHEMQFSGFRSYDEAYQYARQLDGTNNTILQDKQIKGIIISDQNHALLRTRFSYQDYDDFYSENYVPLKITQRYLLSEPAEVATPRERDIKEEIESASPTKEDIDVIQQDESIQDAGFDIPTEEPVTPKEEEVTTEIPTEASEKDATKEIIEEPQTTDAPDKIDPEKDISKDKEPVQETPSEPQRKEEIPTNEQVTDIPVDEPANIIPVDEQVTDIPADEPANISPVDEQVTDIPIDEPATIVNEEVEGTYVVPEEKQQTAPQDPTITIPDEPGTNVQEQPTDDTEIYFDDFGIDNNNTKKPQSQDVNIEDEYYELEGF